MVGYGREWSGPDREAKVARHEGVRVCAHTGARGTYTRTHITRVRTYTHQVTLMTVQNWVKLCWQRVLICVLYRD